MGSHVNHKTQTFVDIIIPATIDSVDQTIISVKGRLEAAFSSYGDFALELVLREALMNAVKHGSGYDAKKKVSLQLTWDTQYFYIRIRDEGPGFLYEAPVSSHTAPSAESGRGMPIIEYYADQISFNDTGNEISIKVAILKSEQGS